MEVQGNDETAYRGTSELRDSLWNALVELRDAFGQFTSRVQSRLVAALSEEPGRETTFAQTRREAALKAGPLTSMAADADLKAVLAALARTEETDDEWLSQLAAIVLKKRLSTWRDNDIEPFGLRMEEVRERMQALEVLRQVLRRDASPQGRKVVVGIAGSDGCVRGGVARVAAKPSLASREMARNFESASPDTRAAWLASLVDTMERQGELA